MSKEVEQTLKDKYDIYSVLPVAERRGFLIGYNLREEKLQEQSKEIERLKGERTNYLLGFIEWAKAVDEYGNKLNYIDVNNFLDNYKPIN
jgi:hypothetical protein